MAIGYFIRKGDKTSCGGFVKEGEIRSTLHGIEQACEGHQVTCGKDGNTYLISGGLSYYECYGKLAAGTLDSVSGCPCRAELYPSLFEPRYGKEDSPAPRASNSARQSPPPSSRGFAPSHNDSASSFSATAPALAPSPAICDERFHLIDKQRQPLGPLDYALLQGNQCIVVGQLDGQGQTTRQDSTTPTTLNLATSAPAPVME